MKKFIQWVPDLSITLGCEFVMSSLIRVKCFFIEWTTPVDVFDILPDQPIILSLVFVCFMCPTKETFFEEREV